MSYKRLLRVMQCIDMAMRELTYVKDKAIEPPPSGGYKAINAHIVAHLACQYGRLDKVTPQEALRVLNTPLATQIEVCK